MHDELRDAAASQLFTKSPAPYLLLTPDLTIFGVNDAYLTRTLRDREDLVGRDMFEAFPDNPADPEANGVANLAGSLGRVLSTRRPDRMPLQRYDIPVPRMGGRFIRKTWTVLNSGLFDERNKVVGLLHHVEDVTSCAPEADLQVDRLSPHSLEALVHGLTACASRYRAALQELGLHDLRVTDALATLVARHGVDARREAQRRRRALWQDVVAEYRAAPSADWLESVCRQTSRVVDPTWSAAVSAFDSAGNPYVLAGSDGWARQLESLQEMVGE